MKQWTQDQSIAYECACDCINDWIGIYSWQIAEEERKDVPDADTLAEMRLARSKLARERASIHVFDSANIARIRTEYGAIVRAWRANHQARNLA